MRIQKVNCKNAWLMKRKGGIVLVEVERHKQKSKEAEKKRSRSSREAWRTKKQEKQKASNAKGTKAEKQRSREVYKQRSNKSKRLKNRNTNKQTKKHKSKTAEQQKEVRGLKNKVGDLKNKGPVYFDKISCTCAAQPCTCAAQHYLYNNRAKNNRERYIYIYKYESCHPDQPVELYFKYCPAPLAKKKY